MDRADSGLLCHFAAQKAVFFHLDFYHVRFFSQFFAIIGTMKWYLVTQCLRHSFHLLLTSHGQKYLRDFT